MHTKKPERAILRVYQKTNKNKNKKKYTEIPERAIPISYKEKKNTSSNKPDVEKLLAIEPDVEKWSRHYGRNRYVDDMNDFASRIFKEFGNIIKPPTKGKVEVV